MTYLLRTPSRTHRREPHASACAVAGHDINDAPHFWRRMAAGNPGSIQANHAASHPATSYRFLALEKTVQEIAEKKRNNQPLVPERKVAIEVQPTQ